MATTLVWDEIGERLYETGVDRGVLYKVDNTGAYGDGVVWNGLTAVNETPTGGEANPQYADNIKYLDLYSAEEFEATIEAFTYPEEFEECDGTATLSGLYIGQQERVPFGFSYRTRVGSDTNERLGYKIHIVYGAKASPSEKSRSTINDSPEAVNFSWSITTNPVHIPGYNPSAHLTINSVTTDPATMEAIEEILYGDGTEPGRMPTPAELIALFDAPVGE